jgi:hypothetical protein
MHMKTTLLASDSPSAADGVHPDTERMMQMIYGFTVSQIVRTFAEFGIADELSEGQRTAADIAELHAASENGMFRLLRAGIPLGLVTADAQWRFSGTSLLRTLERDGPGSLNGFARLFTARGHWQPWGNLPEAVRSGDQQVLPTLGMSLWEYLQQSPDELDAFHEAMGNLSSTVGTQLAAVIDTRSVKVAADIGGGSGALIKALMATNPKLQGIVFDLPATMTDSAQAAAQADFPGRLSLVGGDFFESVPQADLYLLKHILHDWDDANCIRILKNCRKAMHADSRVAIMEMVIAQTHNVPRIPIQDLNMLVLFKAHERTLAEYDALFAAAGLRIVGTKVVQAPLGPTTVIELAGVAV